MTGRHGWGAWVDSEREKEREKTPENQAAIAERFYVSVGGRLCWRKPNLSL